MQVEKEKFLVLFSCHRRKRRAFAWLQTCGRLSQLRCETKTLRHEDKRCLPYWSVSLQKFQKKWQFRKNSFDEALQQLAELIANADDQTRQKYYDLAKDVVDVIEPDLREASQERRHSPSPQPQQRPVRERAQQAVRELARAAAQPLTQQMLLNFHKLKDKRLCSSRRTTTRVQRAAIHH